jgi:hypothetical protein
MQTDSAPLAVSGLTGATNSVAGTNAAAAANLNAMSLTRTPALSPQIGSGANGGKPELEKPEVMKPGRL